MISAVTFLWNEERTIKQSLEALKPYVSEIIIIDLCSTDNTYDICKQYTDKVYKRPHLLCGDEYKSELISMASKDWLLWFYGDEIFSEYTAKSFERFIKLSNKWNAFAFMRHEYMDNIRLNFIQNNKKVYYGTSECPNYQIRLIKKDTNIWYTGLVHAEIHGTYEMCSLPQEYYIEHRKTSIAQEFDNIRLYIFYKYLIWKYGNTYIEPYKKYIDSYKKIVHDSEQANLAGTRKIHLAEEFWYNWTKFASHSRITCEEFKQIVGIDYQNFLQLNEISDTGKVLNFLKSDLIKDRALFETAQKDNINE